ncbi:DUF1653 domain-containing protein [Marinimicrobium sp. ABcell2]|uniref:DUF1653 domain-containing protein n=1 Tax=Marinimicrobium sp. ABcell2 TaxID=3069751 RepID=UPI0027B16E3E|nr:DUF1653 domain-containing protein [Marinimicrobium sp. ABcell2]MDQ2075360.1 DUF1653 domain-containing protein [Marinimicrobium sp. ABcell2]
MVQEGRYRHYKGNEYQVLGVATHSESGEAMVVYRCLYGDYDLWVRPLSMFTEQVTLEGESVPRFRYLGPDSGDGEMMP